MTTETNADKRKNAKANAAPTEMPTDDGAVVAVEDLPPGKTRVEGVFVVATRDGTYPRKGDTYGIFRNAGEVFELNYAEDFADSQLGGWMRKHRHGDPLPQAEPRVMPQTAQRGQPRIANPFPPLG